MGKKTRKKIEKLNKIMKWDKLPDEIKKYILRERFIIMASNALKQILKTDEDLPFNVNANVEIISNIFHQFCFYNYFEWNKTIEQFFKFQRLF